MINNSRSGFLFQCSQELLTQDFAPVAEKVIAKDLVNSLEESTLACMAAGIPADIISITEPYKVNCKKTGAITFNADLCFTGKLN